MVSSRELRQSRSQDTQLKKPDLAEKNSGSRAGSFLSLQHSHDLGSCACGKAGVCHFHLLVSRFVFLNFVRLASKTNNNCKAGLEKRGQMTIYSRKSAPLQPRTFPPSFGKIWKRWQDMFLLFSRDAIDAQSGKKSRREICENIEARCAVVPLQKCIFRPISSSCER